MSYDLLEVPQGYATNLVLIIAPYFDLTFIKEVVRKLSPEKVRLVIDDGVRPKDVTQLLKAASGKADVKIALAVAPGLVHIKGYYVEFVKAEGRARRKRHFLYGSANATDAGFNGGRNAELIADVDLSAGSDRELLDYLDNLVAAVENGFGCMSGASFGPLYNASTLHLPSFKITAPGPAPGFEAWLRLQRGHLAAKYRDAQQFLTVSVALQKQLPQGVLASVFANRGLLAPGARNVVRYRYMRDLEGADEDELADIDDTEGEGTAASQWKSRYCVWTHFGDWLSDDCYNIYGRGLVSKNGTRRREKIDELLKCQQDKEWTNRHKNTFLAALRGVWTDLDWEDDPVNYLRGDSEGIDLEYYGTRFESKLLSDYRLASDKDFYERYVRG